MSFGGLVLTNSGRNELIRAEMGEKFNITHVVLGEGSYNGAYTAIKNIVGEVMQLPITRISRSGEEVLLECDFNSADVPRAFYLREIGIIANGVLCYYDNSREDAEYINPDADVIVKQKRLRFVLLISSDAEVNVKIESSLYALAEELQAETIRATAAEGELAEEISAETARATTAEEELDEKISAEIAQATTAEEELDEKISAEITRATTAEEELDEKISAEIARATTAEGKMIENQQDALDDLYEQLTAYTRQKIAELINGADSSMDTLKEVEDAIAAHKTVMDALDAAIGKKASAAEFDSHAKDKTVHITAAERQNWNDPAVSFNQASSRTNIVTNEKLSVILGKIKKFFADLKTVAFSGSYNDLSNKPTSMKNPSALNIQLNGTSQGAYDGSAAKTVNITPASIGALTAAGNAATSSKWNTARNIGFTGDVVGSASVDGSANVNVALSRRGCIVGQSGSTAPKPVYLFANLSTTEGYVDSTITFHVASGFGDNSTELGILTAHFRTNASGGWESGELVWEYAVSGIDVSKFAMDHETILGKLVVRLWVVIDVPHTHIHFDVISEGNRQDRKTNLWNLINKSSAGGDYDNLSIIGGQYSRLAVLKNPTINTTHIGNGVDGFFVNIYKWSVSDQKSQIFRVPGSSGQKIIPIQFMLGNIVLPNESIEKIEVDTTSRIITLTKKVAGEFANWEFFVYYLLI